MKIQVLTIVLLLPALVAAQHKAKKVPVLTINAEKQTTLTELDKRFMDYAALSKQI